MAGSGAIVQQPVRAEIVRQVKFGKHIAVQIGRATGECPAARNLSREDIFDFAKLHFWSWSLICRVPKEKMFISAVERLGLAFVHDDSAAVFGIKDVSPILKVIADDQIRMAVPIKIC